VHLLKILQITTIKSNMYLTEEQINLYKTYCREEGYNPVDAHVLSRDIEGITEILNRIITTPTSRCILFFDRRYYNPKFLWLITGMKPGNPYAVFIGYENYHRICETPSTKASFKKQLFNVEPHANCDLCGENPNTGSCAQCGYLLCTECANKETKIFNNNGILTPAYKCPGCRTLIHAR
jgi:hypothetical protein